MSQSLRSAGRLLAAGAAALGAFAIPSAAHAATVSLQYACTWPVADRAPIVVDLESVDGALRAHIVTGPAVGDRFRHATVSTLEGEILGDVTVKRAGQPDRSGDLFLPLGSASVAGGAAVTLDGSGATSQALGASDADALVVDRLSLRLVAKKADGTPLVLALAQTEPQSDDDGATFDVGCKLDPATQSTTVAGPVRLGTYVSPSRPLTPLPGSPQPPANSPGAYVCEAPGIGTLRANLTSNFPDAVEAGVPNGNKQVVARFEAVGAWPTSYPFQLTGRMQSTAIYTSASGVETVFPMGSRGSAYIAGAGRFQVDLSLPVVTWPEAGSVALQVQSLGLVLPIAGDDGVVQSYQEITCLPATAGLAISTFRVIGGEPAATTPPVVATTPPPVPTTPPVVATTPPVVATTPPVVAEQFGVAGQLVFKGRVKGTVKLNGSAAITVASDGSKITGGSLTLATASARLTAFGVLPLQTTLALEQPAGTQLGGTRTKLTAPLRLRVTSARLFGLPLVSTSTCRGRAASPTLTASGSTYAGSLPLGPLTGCGALNGLVSWIFGSGSGAMSLEISQR